MKNSYTTRIREILPHLELSLVEAIDPTSADDVVLVNGEIVFRFLKQPRTQAEFANEVDVIELIRERVLLDLPNPFHARGGVIAYKELDGSDFDEQVISLRETDQRAVASQLAGLLQTIHQAPLGIFEQAGLRATPAPGRADWPRFRTRFHAKIASGLTQPQVDRWQQLFDGVLDDEHIFDYEPCLVHGKLHSQHLLFDAKAKRLKSVDGFCRAGLGDAALDIALVMLNWDEPLAANLHSRYPEVAALMERAHIYYQAFLLRRAFVAAESGDLSGFTASLN